MVNALKYLLKDQSCNAVSDDSPSYYFLVEAHWHHAKSFLSHYLLESVLSSSLINAKERQRCHSWITKLPIQT